METIWCPGRFTTSMFRILTILLLLFIVGSIAFGAYYAKNKISALEVQALEKEKELKCYACKICNTPIFKPFGLCAGIDCTVC